MRLIVAAIGVGFSIVSCAAVSGVADYSGGTSTNESAAVSQHADGGDADPDGWTADEGALADDAAGDAVEDVAVAVDGPLDIDARPVCSPQTCNGCCDSNGNCAGGGSMATCGTDGQKCVACGSGDVCENAVCTKAPVDSGGAPPPACVKSSCKSCGAVQSTCCKSDNTCGCAYPFAPCL
ncbi:MAG TPA: hypothetical protein VH044_10235 [Polyangiaceae bacterium]|jgi:hypothetical protein|nr:hypothetical protein [Polyangiaceae bacterium]